jgi:hypothetical protein
VRDPSPRSKVGKFSRIKPKGNGDRARFLFRGILFAAAPVLDPVIRYARDAH